MTRSFRDFAVHVVRFLKRGSYLYDAAARRGAKIASRKGPPFAKTDLSRGEAFLMSVDWDFERKVAT